MTGFFFTIEITNFNKLNSTKMKKIILSLFFVSLFFTSFSQLNGGLKVGLNLANNTQEFDGDKEKSDARIGFHFGGYIIFDLAGDLSIQPELFYNMLGGTDSFDGVDVTIKTDYISVPLMFSYKVGDMFSLQAGPQVSFLVSAKLKADDGNDSAEIDIKDGYKGTDFGANVGLGASFGKFGIDGRYYFGLSNIDDTDDTGDFTEKNSAVTFSVRYKIFGE